MRDPERPTYMQKLRGWLRKSGSVKGEGCRKDSKIVIERGHKDRQTDSEPANWTARPDRQRLTTASGCAGGGLLTWQPR